MKNMTGDFPMEIDTVDFSMENLNTPYTKNDVKHEFSVI
jgi:hypothetical protein